MNGGGGGCTRPVNTDRKTQGTFYLLVSQLKLYEDRYKQYLRLSSELNDGVGVITNGDIPTRILARHAEDFGGDDIRSSRCIALCRAAPHCKSEHIIEINLETSRAKKIAPHRAAPRRKCEQALKLPPTQLFSSSLYHFLPVLARSERLFQ
jgi:hypothetical protein